MSVEGQVIAEIEAPPGHAGARQRPDWRPFVIAAIPCAILVALIIWLAVLQPASFSTDQIPIILGAALVPVLLAVGQSLVMLTGGIDLSVGGLLSLISVLVATKVSGNGEIGTMLPLLLVAGGVAGLLNGLAIVYLRLQPFIVTLATWFIWAGVALYVLKSPGGVVAPDLTKFFTSQVLGIDVPVLIAAIVVILGFLFLRSRWGVFVRAVGSDEDAAVKSGVRPNRVLLAVYTASGLVTALAAVVLASQNGSGDPTVGAGYVLPAVAAAVIGGTSLLGGRGTLVGGVVGALVLTYVAKVTVAVELEPSWGMIFVGALLVGALSLQLLVDFVFERTGGSR